MVRLEVLELIKDDWRGPMFMIQVIGCWYKSEGVYEKMMIEHLNLSSTHFLLNFMDFSTKILRVSHDGLYLHPPWPRVTLLTIVLCSEYDNLTAKLGRKQLEELGAGELKSPKRLSWRL
jgi:hypothetical protein